MVNVGVVRLRLVRKRDGVRGPVSVSRKRPGMSRLLRRRYHAPETDCPDSQRFKRDIAVSSRLSEKATRVEYLQDAYGGNLAGQPDVPFVIVRSILLCRDWSPWCNGLPPTVIVERTDSREVRSFANRGTLTNLFRHSFPWW